ncbi:hypothetical protein OIU84_020979 [Salix udensis]|uniref:Fucosyltransferase n=1 Tax=Salix udensis TaxID=889485 RepID=A0AAD6KU14_9ROSI|nr:hypothetical protein OIU84_020979 [Salix udensis]
MDLSSFTRRRSPKPEDIEQLLAQNSKMQAKRFGSNAITFTKIFAYCLVVLPILFVISLIFRHSSDRTMGFADARVLENREVKQNVTPVGEGGLGGVLFQHADKYNGKLLGGLLADGFDETACASRYSSFLYRKISLHKPSSYLISRLRSYEDLHKRCGPNTQSYNKALEQLKSGKKIMGLTDCNYIVWISFSGLGNRILSLASTFLYALLTNRVLLVDQGKDMADLFCEPFPDKSWLLPRDFPLIDQFDSLNQNSPNCHGNMLKNNITTMSPSLFLIPSFETELSKLFPEKATVFHHLGRYLFHPSNHVWGLITRYYRTYLAKADERIGIQIRIFDSRRGPFKHVMDQILSCTLKEKLLPAVDMQDSVVNPSENAKLKAVLVTSLLSGYSEDLRNMYWEHPTMTGEVVGVYQPSHEEFQQTEKQMHNRKAWAEMYLLSLTDVLVTSAWSTFGYVAQGLGGLRPWILYKTENDTARVRLYQLVKGEVDPHSELLLVTFQFSGHSIDAQISLLSTSLTNSVLDIFFELGEGWKQLLIIWTRVSFFFSLNSSS